eukprot:9100935-Pyramimonas_sp.AAC.2
MFQFSPNVDEVVSIGAALYWITLGSFSVGSPLKTYTFCGWYPQGLVADGLGEPHPFHHGEGQRLVPPGPQRRLCLLPHGEDKLPLAPALTPHMIGPLCRYIPSPLI